MAKGWAGVLPGLGTHQAKNKENGGITLLDINGGNGVYEITNCLFDGAAIQIGWSGNGSMNFHHNILQNLERMASSTAAGILHSLIMRLMPTWTHYGNVRNIASESLSPPHEDGIIQRWQASIIIV